MAQKKLFRFAELKKFSHVFEYPKNMQGKWHAHFNNDNPIVLELACGRGEYTLGLAARYPQKNFIGADVKGNRMYLGAKKAQQEKLTNVAFLRTQIEMLPDYFSGGEADEIWITFPDPQLRTSKAKKRLTHPRFLRCYSQVLKPNAAVHLKTDSPQLYRFTKTVIELFDLPLFADLEDAYADPGISDDIKIKTHYESLDIAGSRKIHYLRFGLPPELKNADAVLEKELEKERTIEV